MTVITDILILLVVARLLGQLMLRMGHPAIVGEMAAGILLGPALLNAVHPSPAMSGISEFAVFMVILAAGLEMDFQDVLGSMKGKGLMISALSFIVPLGSGLLVGIAFELDVMRTIFLGLSMAITALPVAVRILESFDLMKTETARYTIVAAILNDVLALLAVGVILNLPEQRTFQAVAWPLLASSAKLIILFAVILMANWALVRLLSRGVAIHKLPEQLLKVFGNEALFGLVVVFVMIFGALSQMLGFHSIIGAFFGALLLRKDFFRAKRYHDLEKTINSISDGFLAPIFFAYLGLEITFSEIRSPEFLVVVLLVSIASKVLGGWAGGRLAGMNQKDSLGLGIVLNGRGVMSLVVASIALQRGFIGLGLFSTLVLMGVLTTLATPILFRHFAGQPGASK